MFYSRIKKTEKKQPSNSSGVASNPNFLGNIMDSQSDMMKRKKFQVSENYRAKRYNGEYVATGAPSSGNVEEYVKPSYGTNVHYRAWSLRPKAKPQDTFRLIVRGSTHGLGMVSNKIPNDLAKKVIISQL